MPFSEELFQGTCVLAVLMCVAAKIDVLLLFMLLYRFEGAADSSKTRTVYIYKQTYYTDV
jgi:hypothetical protein